MCLKGFHKSAIKYLNVTVLLADVFCRLRKKNNYVNLKAKPMKSTEVVQSVIDIEYKKTGFLFF